jgi:hypothetical protein
MEIGIKDGIYFSTFLVSLAAVWFSFANEIKSNKLEIKKMSQLFKKIIFTDQGQINFVNHRECKEVGARIERKINDGRVESKEISKELKKMSENIILIMYHLKIGKEA